MEQFYPNMKILVLEDQKLAADATVAALAIFVPRENISWVATAPEAIARLREESFGVIFLDVELADTTGFSMAEYLETALPELPYVFLTGYAQYAVQSYNYDPLDFLTKPLDFMRLKKTFRKLEQLRGGASRNISINTEDGFMVFPLEEILYVEKKDRKSILHTVDSRQYILNYSMSEIEIILDGCGFFRCHQSFLIYLGNVRGIRTAAFGTTYAAVMRADVTVPVSRAKYPLLKEKLQQNVKITM